MTPQQTAIPLGANNGHSLALLDDLIGALLKLRGHTEPKCLGGFPEVGRLASANARFGLKSERW